MERCGKTKKSEGDAQSCRVESLSQEKRNETLGRLEALTEDDDEEEGDIPELEDDRADI